MVEKRVKRFIVSVMCLSLSASLVTSQVTDVYDIISATGTIIDKRSGKELKVGDKISFQTDLEFGSLHDKAVLLNSEKSKYLLELPKSSFVSSQLTIASNQALTPAQNRAVSITGTRGNSTAFSKGLSKETLNEYFVLDVFTVIGSEFALPVSKQDAEKYSLLLRYEVGFNIEEYVSTDFKISKDKLKLQGNGLKECVVYLKEGDKEIPVTTLSLIFTEKEQLFKEFASLLTALNKATESNSKKRDALNQYCLDIYGMIDRNTLETTINDFLASKH